MDNNEAIAEVVKEVAKDIYQDGAKPVVKPTGELVGLIPRAIRAALAPVEKWVLQREYNVEETKKLLEQKLKDVPPDVIEPPEPYIAVPALQYISYCMDNDELRNMYANLLANSMKRVVKNGVHPAFVEIIKQLCPDEAKILRAFSNQDTIPTITLRFEEQNEKGHSKGGISYIKDFSDIGERVRCEDPYATQKYFDNLVRLGLLERSVQSSLVKKEVYAPLKEHPYIQVRIKDNPYRKINLTHPEIEEGYIYLTALGKAFCTICLD